MNTNDLLEKVLKVCPNAWVDYGLTDSGVYWCVTDGAHEHTKRCATLDAALSGFYEDQKAQAIERVREFG